MHDTSEHRRHGTRLALRGSLPSYPGLDPDVHMAFFVACAVEDVPEEDLFGRNRYLARCQELRISPVSQVGGSCACLMVCCPVRKYICIGDSTHMYLHWK